MMSITSFQPSDIAASPVLLRGRDSYFWKREIFKRIPQFQPDSEHSEPKEKTFNFIIIFNPRLFLAIEPDGIDEIFDELSRRDSEKENLISIEGKPFFALSNASFQKLRLNLTEDKDLINKLNKNGNVRTIPLKHPFQVLELHKEQRVAENVICYYQSQTLVSEGVAIEDFGHFYIEGMVPIGIGSSLGSGVVIKGDSRIGKNVKIYPHAYLENVAIGDNCTVLPGCIITDSTLEENVTVGPYTHLRMGSLVKKGAKMGNFVEMKKSVLGEGSKSMHLTYIGDADIGKNVNIGAGTITCNYDGVNKNKTIIEDGVFIGSGTELVAPVAVRKNSYVGAGSTITSEVPEDSLAIAREKQRNILGWASKRKKKDKSST